ncbi:MAG TPA: hypothetical protein VEZ13_02035 [Brevibacillus sp.]|nr:hypothetical protein [Brevibacillus sp.]
MANRIYQLSLNEDLDKDILEILDSLPRSRKAEWVRQMIRNGMKLERGELAVVPAVQPTINPDPPVQKKKGKPFGIE